MDATALGIVLGLTICCIYCGIRLWRRRPLDVGEIFVVSVAGFAIPTGAGLIWAALSGNPGELPQTWRVYNAAAGVVTIGLSLQYLINVVRGLFAAPARPAPTTDKGAESGSFDR